MLARTVRQTRAAWGTTGVRAVVGAGGAWGRVWVGSWATTASLGTAPVVVEGAMPVDTVLTTGGRAQTDTPPADVFDVEKVAAALKAGWGDGVPLLEGTKDEDVRVWYGLSAQMKLLKLLCGKAHKLHLGGTPSHTGNGSCVVCGEKGAGKTVTLSAFTSYVNNNACTSAATGFMVLAVVLNGGSSNPLGTIRKELLQLSKDLNPTLHQALVDGAPTNDAREVDVYKGIEVALAKGRTRLLLVADELNAFFTGHQDSSSEGARSIREWKALMSGVGDAYKHTITFIGAGSASSLYAMMTGGQNYPSLRMYPLVGTDFNGQKVVAAPLTPSNPFDLEAVRCVASVSLTDTDLSKAVEHSGLPSREALLRLVALGASSNPRLARIMLQAYCDGVAGASTLQQTDAREGTAFRLQYENAFHVAPLLHSRMFTKNAALWEAAGVNAQTDSQGTIAKKLAVYEDAAGRDWTQLMQPLTMAEAKAAWTDMHRFGGVTLPEHSDVGLAELATNNYIRVIGDHVYPLCAMKIVVDRALPPSYISEPALRPYTKPGDTRGQAEERKAQAEAEKAQAEAQRAHAESLAQAQRALTESLAQAQRAHAESMAQAQRAHAESMAQAQKAQADAQEARAEERNAQKERRSAERLNLWFGFFGALGVVFGIMAHVRSESNRKRDEERAAREDARSELMVRALEKLADKLADKTPDQPSWSWWWAWWAGWAGWAGW